MVFIYPLQLIVSENTRIREKVPEILLPLMDLHFEKVDQVISPGLTVIRWSSINTDAFISGVMASFEELELLIDRVIGIHENRIVHNCKEIEDIILFEFPESGTIDAADFYKKTNELCSVAGATMETKSQVIETAVRELIDMLTGPEVVLETVENSEEPGAVAIKRKMDQRSKLMQEAQILTSIYEQMLIDSQYRLLRCALEAIRKRLAVKMITYGESSIENPDHPLFVSDLVLAMPNIVLKPSLDEIQQWLNKTVTTITSTTKEVYRWGQPRHLVPCPPEARRHTLNLYLQSTARPRAHYQTETSIDKSALKTFHRVVSEHKEIQKLASVLSSAINSTKRVIVTTIEKFLIYEHLWKTEREVEMKTLMEEKNPGVNEFRVEMNEYSQLVEVIALEPDSCNAGAIALGIEKLKLAMSTEARAWVVSYGRTMNQKYQTVMEEVFKSIDDWTKRLSRPLKDLDDIRSIMAALKEIRENEIQVDMSLDPIEVSSHFHACHPLWISVLPFSRSATI